MEKPEATALPYLNYLKLEMTIMGLLAAFCIAVLAGKPRYKAPAQTPA